jgi:hypothetical protein
MPRILSSHRAARRRLASPLPHTNPRGFALPILTTPDVRPLDGSPPTLFDRNRPALDSLTSAIGCTTNIATGWSIPSHAARSEKR